MLTTIHRRSTCPLAVLHPVLPSSAEHPRCCWRPFTSAMYLIYNLWCVPFSFSISITFSLLWSQSQSLERELPSLVRQMGLGAISLHLARSKTHERLKPLFRFQVKTASVSAFSPTSMTSSVTRGLLNPQHVKRHRMLHLKVPSWRRK